MKITKLILPSIALAIAFTGGIVYHASTSKADTINVDTATGKTTISHQPSPTPLPTSAPVVVTTSTPLPTSRPIIAQKSTQSTVQAPVATPSPAPVVAPSTAPMPSVSPSPSPYPKLLPGQKVCVQYRADSTTCQEWLLSNGLLYE